jgi:[protein-PII] uridylyltransferase
MHALTQDLTGDIAALIDTQRLQQTLAEKPELAIATLKSSVHAINDGLKQLYYNGLPVEEIVQGRAVLIDRLMTCAFDHLFAGNSQPVSLIAVGGYGRGELHPCSDIDLMLLLQEQENTQTRETIEKFIMMLWDAHLEIGHSVRTVQECMEEADNDITVATNIMEARLLAGDKAIFEQMIERTGPDKIWDDRSFFRAKLDEQIHRNGKFNDTAFNLEPNIKEGHGGLRDIQMIGWVAKRHFGTGNLHDLLGRGFLREEELQTLRDGQHLLWRIRCSLHYITGRREDRMLFDYQRQMAHEFGFEDDPEKRSNQAIENFMQQYYRTVTELERLNEMLLQLLREAILYGDDPGEAVIINDTFQARHGYIEVRDEKIFSTRPTALLELFMAIEQHPEIQGVRAETIRLIREHRHLIDDDFRRSTEARRMFMQIISQSRGVTHELMRMNRYGILAAYIPAFEKIVGRMQYDLFHAYTVDQHTLFVLRNLRRLAVPDHCHEFPLASGIFHHLENPVLLYLAGLFHDIAKGRQGDHSELGAVDALEFCLDHGLNDEQAELVSWLVRNHLIMSITAQRKDISDPEIIAEFAQHASSISRLDYLYLLTLCDIRATNPAHWNSWKNKLLVELYSKTAQVLRKGPGHLTDKQDDIHHHRTYALRSLSRNGLSSRDVHHIWQNFTDEYFLRHTPGEIVWHTQLIVNHPNLEKPLVKTRTGSRTGSLELMVCSRTRDYLFAQVVSVLGQHNLNVVDAYIMRCTDGFSMETFRIVFSNDMLEHLDHYAREIIQRIEDKLTQNDPGINVGWLMPRIQKHFNVATRINFDRDTFGNTTRLHIETGDRPGLLATIAKVFIDCGVRIHSAKISTAGEVAMDYFDLTCKESDVPLTEEQKITLAQVLQEQL